MEDIHAQVFSPGAVPFLGPLAKCIPFPTIECPIQDVELTASEEYALFVKKRKSSVDETMAEEIEDMLENTDIDYL
jgi:hypothetical protein